MAIAATPAVVWRILCDFPRYPAWNPFIVSVDGRAEPGQRLRARMQLAPEGRMWRFAPRITHLQPERELCWRGRLVLPGLFDGHHCFHLEPAPGGGTRLLQREEFSGLLVRWLPASLYEATRRAFEQMNEALKQRAERGARQP